MKNRFTTLDLIAILPEIKEKLIGKRVYQVYDIDNKTFLIRFTQPALINKDEEETLKQVLIIESGIRIHLTDYDWPKSSAPSGFTMKLRKHIKNKRLESVQQFGNDRIIDLQFGSAEYCNHIILELYSKGNIILTDKDYVILSLVRIFKDSKTNTNIAVRQTYPLNKHMEHMIIDKNKILQIINDAKENNFKKVFNRYFVYGPNLLEHSLLKFCPDLNVNTFKVTENDVELLENVFKYADSLVNEMKMNPSKGYIIQRNEKKGDDSEKVLINDEFQPYLFKTYKGMQNYLEYDTFNQAVDIFFSSMESQKIESKMIQNEKQAMKKLEAIRKDHESRLENLSKLQESDNERASLIENNIELVESAISVLRSAIANKYSWEMIAEMVKDAQDAGDPIASRIKALKLEKNCFTMQLKNPYEEDGESMEVDIDIDISAYANARKYYDHRKDAAKKEQKTLDHSEKVFKNVEKKIKQQLKENTIKTNIVMAKKTLWFEKFFWFISSEGYLIIAGRDAQQNEMIVKRYLNKNDLYVHADIHGATSVVIKNHTETEISPKTINEAANMAVCFSASWDAKVVSVAYWVYSHQVQKTAPTGQYLSVGSFMIRGKKNYIPLQNLVLGFGILFRIDEESLEQRKSIKQQEQSNQLKDNLEEKSAFPDSTFKYKDVLEEHMAKTDDNDYTIVNTAENVKKKVKIITQKNLKKTNQTKVNKKTKQLDHQKQERSEFQTSMQIKNTDNTKEDLENKDPLKDNDEKEDNLAQNEPEDDEEENVAQNEPEDDEEEEEELSKSGIDSKKIISSLISNPNPTDNLLYAIPVCGPYTTLQGYKYKVKIIPGTTKRGKASKTALMIFLKEKTATEREKDLLKAIKDQDISKNMPAKVKIVAKIQNK